MNITIAEFMNQLIGARASFWSFLKLEEWLWSHFAFADDGAHFIQTGEAKPYQPSAAIANHVWDGWFLKDAIETLRRRDETRG